MRAKVRTEGQVGINRAIRESEEGDRRMFLAKKIAGAKSPKEESKIEKLFKFQTLSIYKVRKE